jgi:hypothetical protein
MAVLAWAAALPALTASCRESPVEVELRSQELAGNDVVLPSGDLVYRYLLATANADSLLRLMRRDGVPVREALQPLEDLCADPIGPRFTVVLCRIYQEIASFTSNRGRIGRAPARSAPLVD